MIWFARNRTRWQRMQLSKPRLSKRSFVGTLRFSWPIHHSVISSYEALRLDASSIDLEMNERVFAVESKPIASHGQASISEPQAQSVLEPRSVWQRTKARIIGGLLLVLPILITFWVFHWLYSNLEQKVIDPIALLVLVEGSPRPD